MVRTHRIGSITFGCILVLFGILFMGHIIFPGLNYEMIFGLWPLVFVGLGAEILATNIRHRKGGAEFVYDWAAILLMIILMFFAMVMAGVDLSYRYYGEHFML